ncbi:unnamed protein product [Macrosiphum euphorbiae]|uniref:SH3 domain-containing protein n=1 Tax=Macrosiphum euphorbiae TaxID=13131 RepID=A0AAV0XTP5_9HEMI|nr:unnamed protein product [Macrosiphum euphorbiae]
MPKTKKETVKDKKQCTSKKTAIKRIKRPVYKFNLHKILKNRQLEKNVWEQTAKHDEEMKVIDESYQELNETIDFEDNDKLPIESIHFDPAVLSNYNIPFKDSSDSDLTKLCMQRLQIMLIEGNELEASIHFNHLMKANWSPVFDIVQNILCKWSADLDTQTSDPSIEYQIKNYKNIKRHNFELVLNCISSSILKNNKTFCVDELLTIAKYTVTIYFHLGGQMINVLKRLFSVCIETALEKDNGSAIIVFAEELYSEHNEDNLLIMMVDLFLPLEGQILEKMYTYLTYKIFKLLLGKTDNKNTFPSSIKEWFVQDLLEMNYFKENPNKVLSSVVQLLEHVVFVFDLYQEDKKMHSMYNFLNSAIKHSGISDSIKLVNIIDQWRLRLFRLFVDRQAGTLGSSRESGLGSDSDNMAELAQLLQADIPEGRKSLTDSHVNLVRVAEYCEVNYFQAENKRLALEETKNYTTQSLASVACQINTLAYNFLQLLDLQTIQLSKMDSQINHIAQNVMIHKEIVARQEIGVLTTNKTTNRQHKIIAPANPEKPIKYVRKPIDFTALDDIGHGVRKTSCMVCQPISNSSSASTNMSFVGPAPTIKPPTPPAVIRATGSLSKGYREYRTTPAVAPRQVPSHYALNYLLAPPSLHTLNTRMEVGPDLLDHHLHQATFSSNTSQQSSTDHYYSNISQQSSTDHYHYLSNTSQLSSTDHFRSNLSQQSSTVHYSSNIPQKPPADHYRSNIPQLTTTDHYRANTSQLPGILKNSAQYYSSSAVVTSPQQQHTRQASASLPLPRPPEDYFGHIAAGSIVPQEPDLPGWVPKNYSEKVIAIYDYYADKDDELSFQENSVIYVLKKNDDGWWEGVMDGITGLFPGNYVEGCK